jgi:hypothetical protein
MKAQKLCSIAELGNYGSTEIQKFLAGHDFVAELDSWALEAASNGVQHTSNLEWNKKRLKKVFHPSGLSGECDFKLWMDIHGAPYKAKQAASLQGIFDTGTAVGAQMEYYVSTHAQANEYSFLSEVGFKPRYVEDSTGTRADGSTEQWVHSDIADELQIAGHLDGLCIRTIRVGGRSIRIKMVYEFKTISSGGFRKLTKPHDYYRKQVHAYMVCLDAPITIIFYVNKDNSSKASFPITYSPEYWQPMEGRLRSIKKLHDNHKEPDKVVGPACWQCGYLEECDPRPPKRSPGHMIYGAPEI